MYLQFNKKKGKNDKVYSSVLLCEKYRENGAIKTKVVLNLSKLPNETITALKAVLNKTKGALIDSKDVKINQTIDYGYAFAVTQIMDRLRISETIEKTFGGNTDQVKLMIVGKLLTGGSKLSIFNWIKRNEFLANKLSIKTGDLKKVDTLYSELGEFGREQEKIERKWNLYHNKSQDNDIFLYDITSTYFEGTQNELAAFGYNRDGKKGKMQITIGLITNSKGFPLKIEVFEGNVNDHKTVNGQLLALKGLFNAKRLVLVGDRGMRIRLNLEEMDDKEKQGMHYISALTSNEITAMLKDGTIQLSLFSKELAEIEKDGTRYILSRNPQLEREKGETRERLKQRFEQEVSQLKGTWQKRWQQNQQNKIKLEQGHKNKKLTTCFTEKRIDSFKYRATELTKRYRVGKYYHTQISNDEFLISFDLEAYQQQKDLDGKYIIETTVKKDYLDTGQVRKKYKELQNVEHAFRDLKSDRINIRPVFHRNEAQTRGHVFVCMFAYAIAKEMEESIFPWLKRHNQENKSQLAFDDIIDELKNIKMSELELGYQIKELRIPELNPLQAEILTVLKLKPEDMITA